MAKRNYYYPEKQDKVHEELYEIFGDDDRACTIEDTRRMTYLECCFKETMRLYTAAPSLTRRVQHDVMIEGHMVPRGVNILFYIPLLHQNPKYFSNPKEFQPERFMESESRKRHAYSYLPFSAGPRNCIGQRFAMLEQKVLLSTILRHFQIKSRLTQEEMKTKDQIGLCPQGRIDIKISNLKGTSIYSNFR